MARAGVWFYRHSWHTKVSLCEPSARRVVFDSRRFGQLLKTQFTKIINFPKINQRALWLFCLGWHFGGLTFLIVSSFLMDFFCLTLSHWRGFFCYPEMRSCSVLPFRRNRRSPRRSTQARRRRHDPRAGQKSWHCFIILFIILCVHKDTQWGRLDAKDNENDKTDY
jgi:hypothetical protein